MNKTHEYEREYFRDNLLKPKIHSRSRLVNLNPWRKTRNLVSKGISLHAPHMTQEETDGVAEDVCKAMMPHRKPEDVRSLRAYVALGFEKGYENPGIEIPELLTREYLARFMRFARSLRASFLEDAGHEARRAIDRREAVATAFEQSLYFDF